MRCRALILAALTLALAACQATPAAREHAIITALERELGRLEQEGLAGQVLIIQGQQPVLERAMGQLRPGEDRPMSMESVMPLASLSKPFTASAMLALEADGDLRLDDPLGQHLQGLSRDWHTLPLHHLLTHTAGLSAEIFNPAYAGHPRFEPIDRRQLIDRVNHFPPHSPPGANFIYSNVGYNLAAAVIETVSGRPLEQFLRERLLEPAALEDIGLLLPRWHLGEVASGRDGERFSDHHLLQPRLDDGLGWLSRGSGDLLARPSALAAWWQTLRAGTWLPQPWMQQFLTPQVAQSDGGLYGFGLEFRDGPLGAEIGHTGADLDFTIAWTWYPRHDLMIYVALADSRWRADQLSAVLAQSMLPHLPL